MFTITVSFKPSGSNAEVIAQVIKLLAELENSGVNRAKPRARWKSWWNRSQTRQDS